MGKTTHTLRETENCIDFLNLNMVFEFNITLEDVLQKAKPYPYSTESLDRKIARNTRKGLIIDQDYVLPTMFVGIWDVYRAEHVESLLLWAKHRGIPTRMILDEYDVFGVGHTRREACSARDESVNMLMQRELIDILEMNSATNISGVISDIKLTDVNRIKPYDGYCGWESLQIETLDEHHFTDLLNGHLTNEFKRKLGRSYQSQENVLMNLHDRTEEHETIATAVDFGAYSNIKTINYSTNDSLDDIPESNTLIVGGQKFGRSVSIPNLTTCFYYRKSIPAIATLLQAVGRVLGPRPFDPVVVTTPTLARSIEQGYRLEQKIIDEEILLYPPTERVQWLNEQVQNLDCVKLFTAKSNGYRESKRAEYRVTEDVEGFHKFDHYFETDIPMELWDTWETKDTHSTKRSNQLWSIFLEKLPFLDDVKGIRSERDGAFEADRKRIGIKESNKGYGRYVHSKRNYRNYPIMYGTQLKNPGKAWLIWRDPDVEEYTDRCWHHNEYGQKVRLVQKIIER